MLHMETGYVSGGTCCVSPKFTHSFAWGVPFFLCTPPPQPSFALLGRNVNGELASSSRPSRYCLRDHILSLDA